MRFMRKLKKKLNNRKGVSLGEMLMCVVLVGFLSMLMCTGVLMSFKATDQISQASYAMTVSDTIMNSISGELTEASGGGKIHLTATEDSPVVAFTSSSGVPMFISAFNSPELEATGRGNAGSGYLMKYYCKTAETPASAWSMDINSYMGYAIDSLSFSAAGKRNGCVLINVKLGLREVKGGKVHTTTGIVCCYNVKDDVDTSFSLDRIINSENYTETI